MNARLFRMLSAGALMALTLSPALSVRAAPLAPAAVFFEGFETGTAGWITAPTRVSSGTNGIVSFEGGFHGESHAGDFTRWGGYSSVFPPGGYTTFLALYLDMATGAANDTRFDFSSAINDSAGNHRRDFVLTGGFYNDSDFTGSGSRFVFSVSNTSPGWPKNPGRSPYAITASGWITIEHRFYDAGAGVLAVDVTLRNPAGAALSTWTLSDPSDLIGSTVGGNRYGWFVTNYFPYLAIDNALLILPPQCTTWRDTKWVGCASIKTTTPMR